MGFICVAFERIKKQGSFTLFCWVFAKFLFGVGLGLLLAEYFRGYSWTQMGWLLIFISIVLGVLVAMKVFGKKR
jgi:F0F1-type ATP synthase assembly protein I